VRVPLQNSVQGRPGCLAVSQEIRVLAVRVLRCYLG